MEEWGGRALECEPRKPGTQVQPTGTEEGVGSALSQRLLIRLNSRDQSGDSVSGDSSQRRPSQGRRAGANRGSIVTHSTSHLESRCNPLQ